MPGRDGIRGVDFAALVTRHLDGSARSATHDALTGMPNRVLFQAILKEACAADDGVALLRVVVDDIAALRADHGQATADTLIVAVAGRLARSIRAGDVAAKLRDADFGLILAAADVAEAACAAQRVLERLREPFEVSGTLLDVNVSIGIAFAAQDARAPDVLLERAEIALERARVAGSGAFKIYKPSHRVDPETQRALLADLRHALANREMTISFRPEVDLDTLRLRGAEAVLQWDHPKIGLIGSTDFLPVLGDAHAARLLADWTIEQTCRAARTHGLQVPIILVLDPSVEPDERLVERVLGSLADHDIAGTALALGISETVFRGLGAPGLRALASLRREGLRIVLDDYTGTALSLEELRALPIDAIRTCPSALDELEADIGAFARLQGLTVIASSIGIPIAAKGVESGEEMESLRRFGFALIQGGILGTPLTESELAAYDRTEAPIELAIPRM